MDASGKQIHDQVDDATALLLQTVDRLGDADVSGPSLLPGWTRGHVLTHLARGADVLRDLLEGGTGYASQEQRLALLEAGAGRGVAEQAADLRATAAAFRDTVLRLPGDAWQRMVTPPFGMKPFPGSRVLLMRLVEIELHHVDLDAGYKSYDWPTTFNELELADPMRQWRADRIF